MRNPRTSDHANPGTDLADSGNTGQRRWLRPLAGAAVIAVALSTGPLASASTLDRVSALDRIQKADMIFEGVVAAIEYRSSDVSAPGQVSLPHTFVTYSIRHTFKGQSVAGNTLTLRMQGGPDDRGRTMKVSGVPEFRVGDRDILFVQGNGSSICPLVGWEQGRFRVVRDSIFNDLGQEVWVRADGEFALGDVRIDVNQEFYPEVAQSSDLHEPRPAFVPPAGALRPDARGFNAILERMLIEASAKGLLPRVGATASMSIGDSFSVAALTAAPPPSDFQPAKRDLFQGEFDPREAELIRKARSARSKSNDR